MIAEQRAPAMDSTDTRETPATFPAGRAVSWPGRLCLLSSWVHRRVHRPLHAALTLPPVHTALQQQSGTLSPSARAAAVECLPPPCSDLLCPHAGTPHRHRRGLPLQPPRPSGAASPTRLQSLLTLGTHSTSPLCVVFTSSHYRPRLITSPEALHLHRQRRYAFPVLSKKGRGSEYPRTPHLHRERRSPHFSLSRCPAIRQ